MGCNGYHALPGPAPIRNSPLTRPPPPPLCLRPCLPACLPACRDVCNSGAGVEEKMARLGALMDDSHASCRDLDDCSSPELEELVKARARRGGAGCGL